MVGIIYGRSKLKRRLSKNLHEEYHRVEPSLIRKIGDETEW